MDNPNTLATLGKQDTERKQTNKQKIKTKHNKQTQKIKTKHNTEITKKWTNRMRPNTKSDTKRMVSSSYLL